MSGATPARDRPSLRARRLGAALGIAALLGSIAVAAALRDDDRDQIASTGPGRTTSSVVGDRSSTTAEPPVTTATSAPVPTSTAATGSTTTPPATSTTPPPSTSTPAPGASCPAASWTLRQRLGQLVMVGVDPSGSGEARQVVERDQLGGIFIGGNATGLLSSGVLSELRGADGVAPFVAVDDEGGRVQRLDDLEGDLASPRVLAKTATLDDITALAEARGRALARYGVTIDFAPSVDVTTQGDREVIGDRSFGDDPDTVIRNARAFASGLGRAGIMTVYKHFPGHGHAVGDSHQGASTTPDLAALDPDLAPYRALLAEPGDHAVMIGHLVVPGLTNGEPASLSPEAVNGLLRRDLGYQGLVFTDELGGMRAVADRYGRPEAVRRSLAAGVDVALLAESGGAGGLLDHLEGAVADGSLPMAQVDASFARVMAAKGYRCPG